MNTPNMDSEQVRRMIQDWHSKNGYTARQIAAYLRVPLVQVQSVLEPEALDLRPIFQEPYGKPTRGGNR